MAHPVGTAAPQLHSGCHVQKWAWHCQSFHFSRDSGNLDVFCAISLCINIGNRSKHLHSAHVGELWPRGYQLVASSPGPYKLQCEGLASLVTPGLASEPYL